MLHLLDLYLSSRSRGEIIFLSILAILLLGFGDYKTRESPSFSMLYLFPVSMASWYGNRMAGFIAAVLSSIIRVFSDIDIDSQMNLGNFIVHLGVLFLVAYFLSQIHIELNIKTLLAQTDELTGLGNFRAYRRSYRQIIRMTPIAVGYLDIDRFKRINDLFGHRQGNKVLQEIAMSLSQQLHPEEFAFRLSGDEFAILLPQTDLKRVKFRLQEMREDLVRLNNRKGWLIGFSWGVAVFYNPPPDPEIALKEADACMYHSKKEGKQEIKFAEFALKFQPSR